MGYFAQTLAMTTYLSPHFTLEEFVFSQTASRCGMDNTPTGAERDNLDLTAHRMEAVRKILGSNPILISSGYRSPEVNQACGGSDTSAHMSGLAVDFICPDFGSPYEVCKAIEPYIGQLKIDQLIYEYEDWIHIGWTDGVPREQAMTINDSGTYNGIA